MVEKVNQREELDDKLGGRVLTLSRCVEHNHGEVLALIKELRREFKSGLEIINQSAREEAEALLMLVRDQAADTPANMYLKADNARRAVRNGLPKVNGTVRRNEAQ